MKNKLMALMVASFFSSYACVATTTMQDEKLVEHNHRILTRYTQPDLARATQELESLTFDKYGNQARGFIFGGSFYQLIEQGGGTSATHRSVVELGKINENNEVLVDSGSGVLSVIKIFEGTFVNAEYHYGSPKASAPLHLLPPVNDMYSPHISILSLETLASKH